MNKIAELKKAAKKNNVSAQKIKIDHLIISCALIHGAACIYTTDKGLKAFGERFIDIREYRHYRRHNLSKRLFLNPMG